MSMMSRSKASSSTKSSDTTSSSSLFACRPNQGITGRPMSVFANHFPIKYMTEMLVYHYDVDMEPMSLNYELSQMRMTEDTDDKSTKKRFKKLDNKIYRIVVEEAIRQYSGSGQLFDGVVPVYDGQKNMYTKKALDLEKFSKGGDYVDEKPMVRIKVDVNEDGHDVSYALNMKLASAIDFNNLRRYFDKQTHNVPSDCIQVLNIILRHGPTLFKIPIANSLYAPYNEAAKMRKDIGGGRQLAYGYFQSVRPEAYGVSLVIDRTATALYISGLLIKFMASVLGLNREQFMSLTEFRDSDRKRLDKELKGILIQVRHLTYKRKYKVIGLTPLPASRVVFDHKKVDARGNETSLGDISVVEFFQQNYPNCCPLKFEHLPCIMVGNPKKPNYLPLDVCELVDDQHVRKNLTSDQMVEMIRESASQSPENRLKFIKESAKSTIIDSKTYMKEFGISFSGGNAPLKIEARVLKPPQLKYGQNRDMDPFDGKWDVKHLHFYQCAPLEHWIIICLSQQVEPKMETLERYMIETGRSLGMRVLPATKRVYLRNYGSDTITNAFKKATEITGGRLQLIVFVISPKYQYLYESIKKVGDIDFGVTTQCIKEANLNRLKPPLMQNIMLKVNTKLGGINAVLNNIEVLKKRTMIVGVDCSHPGVGDRMSRSVSAAVASIDDSYVRYFATTRLQRRVQDLSQELQEMMLDLLREYAKHNDGILPEQIIIYRDGVSEGQFNAALQQEIKGLASVFAQENEGYQPLLTYIVVQKRHHTRFFPVNLMEGVGKAKNVPPGLVVDTDVVSKTYFDYFLCSHEGIQGTSRPTHYFILMDENNLSADQLQQLTFSLTHIYARCTRSISYPAPVAYAHLAAYRTQRHIIGLKQNEDSESGSYGGSSIGGMAPPRRHRNDEEGLMNKMKIKTDFKNKMYFC
ncbi:protein argonaute-2-like [Oppia nitens]|uniref:protein argonaute-2-like n=1 Tax=Oppia nitens TaxID=1686743 RepID=UPI0023DC8DF4|nr:protein argonaute-2-like [Oppia nitens]